MNASTKEITQEIINCFGMFSVIRKAVVSKPQLTTNRPQLHHKSTTTKMQFSQNTLQKHPEKHKKSPGRSRDFFNAKSRKTRR